jgi:hypothetical protein
MNGIRKAHTQLPNDVPSDWTVYIVTDTRIQRFIDSQSNSLFVNRGYDFYVIGPALYTLICLLA